MKVLNFQCPGFFKCIKYEDFGFIPRVDDQVIFDGKQYVVISVAYPFPSPAINVYLKAI